MYHVQNGKAVDLAEVLEARCGVMFDRAHDDGSYAPLLIRFAWHCCGTYDRRAANGGPDGGTMRFGTEQADPENAGLAKARALRQPLRRPAGLGARGKRTFAS